MVPSQPTREDLEEKIQEAYALIEQEAPLLPERLYNALEGISSVFLAYKQGKGQEGWSQKLMGLNKKPLFSNEQSKQIEKVFSDMKPQLVELFGDAVSSDTAAEVAEAALVGGAFSDVKTGATSQLVMPMPALTPDQISIDNIYSIITKKLDEYDEQWGEIANGLGLIQMVEGRDYRGVIGAPPAVIPYVIPGKVIFPLLNTVLDLIRLAVGNPAMDIAGIRILLSFVLAILDLLRGDWQNALLSAWGVVSAQGVVIGFFLKFIRNAFLLISPDLRRQLRDDVYKSGKSMFVGFLLWSFSIFSPDFIRMTIQKSFDSMATVIENFNNKVAMAEDKANQAAAAAGVKVTFPKIPLEMVPSMDDLENLQTIARVPEVYCSKEVQDIIQPLLVVPPLRLVLELLNIPTVPDDVDRTCAAVGDKGLADAVAEKVEPKVEIIPGGPLDQASKMAEQASDLGAMAMDPTAAATAALGDTTAAATKALGEPAAALEKKASKIKKEFPPTKVTKGGATRKKSRGSKKRKGTYRRRRERSSFSSSTSTPANL